MTPTKDPAASHPRWRQLAGRHLVAALGVAVIAIIVGLILVSNLEQTRSDLRRTEARQVMAGRTTAVRDRVGQIDKAAKGLAYAAQQANGDFGLEFETVGSYTQSFLGGDVLAVGSVNGPVAVYPSDRSADIDATLPCSQPAEEVTDEPATVTLVDRLASGGSALRACITITLADGSTHRAEVLSDINHVAQSAGLFDLSDYRWQLLSPSGTVLASDVDEPITDALQTPFTTPIGDWSLHFAPVDGWHSSTSLPIEIGFVVTVGILIGLATFFGLSRRRRLESQVAKRTKELADTAARLSEAVDRQEQTVRDLRLASDVAEKASRAKTEFLSRMSHELRTPLNAVLGFAQLLEMESLADADQESVSEILGAGRHLLNLINEVLDLASIEEGRLAIEHQLVDLREVAARAQRMLEPDARRAGVEICVDGDNDDLFADADTQRVQQIVINLVANAVKYGASGGKIAITLEREHDRCRIVVTDHGPGIDPTRAHLLFQPFERLGARDGPQPGTGIGLALSRRLAEVMDGSVDYEPTPGGGSQFALSLPASNVSVPVPEGQLRA